MTARGIAAPRPGSAAVALTARPARRLLSTRRSRARLRYDVDDLARLGDLTHGGIARAYPGAGRRHRSGAVHASHLAGLARLDEGHDGARRACARGTSRAVQVVLVV